MPRSKRRCPESQPTWDASSLLRSFYLAEFRPSIANRLHPKWVERYDSALRRFERFVVGGPLLGSVTYELLDEFSKAARSPKCSVKNAKNLAGCILSIVRHWRGEKLPRIEELPQPEPGTLRHYFESRYLPEVMFDCKRDSITDTRRAIRRLRSYMGNCDVQLEALSDSQVAGMLQELRDNGRLATTVNKYRRMLTAVWTHAFNAEAVSRSPRVKKLREVQNPPEAWTLADMKILLAAARRFRPGHKYGPLRCDRWWPALLHVAYDCALRRSSLLAIRQDHIDLAGGWLLVEGDTTKTLKGQSFKLSDDTVAALREIWEPARQRVFEFVTARTINDQFDLPLDAAGVRRCRSKTLGKFHMLRRTTATLIGARAGILAASATLGHSSAEVTRRHYVDPTQIRHDAASLLPSLGAG